jgi:predicted transcriptional regulator
MEAAMNFGENAELAEKKLILLYIINKVNMPVSNLQITKIILENKFMNYFFFQQFLTELCENGQLLAETVDEKILYTISQKGTQVLDYFSSHIPVGVKKRIDETISSIRKNIKNETLITADYTPENENEYIVTCKVNEDNFSLIDLKITVGTKSDAREVCNNWKKTLSANILRNNRNLIRKRD